MTFPRVLPIAWGRIARQTAGAGMLLATLTSVFMPVRAEDQPDPYSATVKVDATAESAAAARTIARTDGQRRALDDVVERLSGSSDLSKLPKLDDAAITDMVGSFEVADEKMSRVRYLANYTFHFVPAKIRRLMRTAGIAPAAAATAQTLDKPVVVVPVYRAGDSLVLWDDPNPWREAWGQVAFPSGPAKLVVPLGGVDDLKAIDAEQARAGDAEALRQIAQHNGADDALVAIATARQQGQHLSGIDVALKRYHLGQLSDDRGENLDARPGESEADFLKRAVGIIVAEIDHRAPAVSDKEASLAATIPIGSLGDWIELQRRLSAAPGVHAVELVSLSRHQVKVVIRFVGKPEELKSSLAQANLDLNGADPDWRLVPVGAPSPN